MMHLLFVCAGVMLTLGSLHAQQYPHIAPTDPKTPAEELKTFKVPEGFEVQLVAADPDIRKPIQIAFDAKGRLWATTSEEYPYPALGRPGKDRLYVMEDFGADGKAKKISIFADDLNIPIGVLPLPDCKSVIVSSVDTTPPKKGEFPICWIWKLTDTDGDGLADKKEKLYGPFGARDTHGMNNSYTLMPDGWVYACHGYLNDSKPKGKDGHEITMNSGNTFRFRPDGSRIEIWTRGQVNPFGIAVDPYFNLYTADCHSKPITQLIRGATYQSFTKGHDGLGFAPHVTVHGHESTALCGLVYYAADHFPKEYLDHMFLGNVTSNCINWDKIEFKGSTSVATDKGQFLSSSDLWCRPTDIKLGPDGALYWADFYNKIIGHYEVPLDHQDRDKLRGRVWRIIWKGKDGKGETPKLIDLSKLTLQELCTELANPNLSVRIAAIQLIQAHAKSVASARQVFGTGSQPERRALRVWAMMTHWPVDPIVIFANRPLWEDESPVVRSQVIRALNSLPNVSEELEARIVRNLLDEDKQVQRAALDALTSSRFPGNVRSILDLYHKTPESDNHMRYAAKVALREQLKQSETWTVIPSKNWTAADARAVAEVSLAIPNDRTARYLLSYLKSKPDDSRRFAEYLQHIARYYADDTLKPQIADLCQSLSDHPAHRSTNYLAVKRGHDQRGTAFPKELMEKAIEACTASLAANDNSAVQAGIDLAISLRTPSLFDSAAKLAAQMDRPEAQRLAALGGLGSIDADRAVPIFVRYLSDSAASIALREKAAQSLAQLNRADAQDELIKSLTAAPARLQTIIAMAMAGNLNAAEKLLRAIQEGKASARLLQDNAVQTRLREARVPNANQRIAALTKGLPTADQKMLGLMKQRSAAFAKTKPDAMLGKALFAKHCGICHQINNEGTKIGPQLDGIGGRGLDRLLEDILDPNRNVDVAFRQTTLMLKDGKSIPGLLLREEGQIVVMADDKGKETRVPKDDIDEKRSSLLSPMPANMIDAIPEKDFHDLMAYLLTQRAKEK
jgi:putative heme-binding domain-containing protein